MKSIKRILTIALASTMMFAFAACNESGNNEGTPKSSGTPKVPGNATTTPETTGNATSGKLEVTGEIKIKLFPEVAPVAVQNFIDLTEREYYSGKLIHRIIPNFMFQGGSPFGDGRGGDGYPNFSIEPSLKAEHIYGALAMANAGPDNNSQQFYIVNNKQGTPFLNGDYTVFGQTLEGFEVIDDVSSVKTGAQDRPVDEVVIESVTIHIFTGGEDPGPDSLQGNVGGEVKLENGDVYAVISIRYTKEN